MNYLTFEDPLQGHLNPEYDAWEQDLSLLAWHQSSLSGSILSRAIGSQCLYEVWDNIHN